MDNEKFTQQLEQKLKPTLDSSEKLYIINRITSKGEIKPVFITDDQTFGVNFFNQYKIIHGMQNDLCQIEPLSFIKSDKFKNTDIQQSTIENNGDINEKDILTS